MSLRLNRRSEGGLVPYVPPRGQDWRLALRARAWRVRKPRFWARQTGQPWGVRVVSNPDAQPVSAVDGLLTFAYLGLAGFVALVVLHLLGVWT
jgi:hypothetical protein